MIMMMAIVVMIKNHYDDDKNYLRSILCPLKNDHGHHDNDDKGEAYDENFIMYPRHHQCWRIYYDDDHNDNAKL